MTAVPPRCCLGCAGPCRRRTGRTSRLVACIERRRTRPSACCAAVSVPFARWRAHRRTPRRAQTSGCTHVLLNKPRDRPACQTASRFDGTDVQGVDAVAWLVAHRLTGGGCRAGRSASFRNYGQKCFKIESKFRFF